MILFEVFSKAYKSIEKQAMIQGDIERLKILQKVYKVSKDELIDIALKSNDYKENLEKNHNISSIDDIKIYTKALIQKFL